MDVHAPHAPLHTWKDFWIHLGTITIGLLIAIGLEQSVEWMHHLHQRHVLEADLREEARKNLILMDIDYKYFDAMRPWMDAMRKNVDDARTSRGKIKAVYQTRRSIFAKLIGLMLRSGRRPRRARRFRCCRAMRRGCSTWCTRSRI